jgi:membrane protein DedA with SNARE-associated domain
VTFSLIEAVVNAATVVMSTIGLPGLFALMALSVFGLSPIPAELILPLAGFLVFDGAFSFGWALAVSLVGTMVGAYAGYAVGRWWRDRITGIGVGHLRIEARHLEWMDRFFARYGELAVALLRNVPVVRSYISYPAGTARMEPVRYGVYTLLGATPYTVALIWAGMALRSNWVVLAGYFQLLDLPLLAVIVAVVLYLGLQVAGVLAPGWPPRRARAPPETPTSVDAPPETLPPPP